MKTVYLNGQFLPVNQAQISVMDRGFLFGDGVYEVIPVYNKKLFRLEQHLQRLNASLKAIRVEFDLNQYPWEKIFTQLIESSISTLGNNQAIYLQITRGATPERSHYFSSEIKPTIFAYAMPFNRLSYEDLNKGMSAITLEDIRWQNCYIKAITLLPNLLMYQHAKDSAANEAILLRNDEAVEASTSNLFIVKNNMIITPPLSNFLLNGVTRNLILELAKQNNLPCQENKITEAELRDADEIWVASSTKEIYPIIKLDGKSVGNGKPGLVWNKIIKYYKDYVSQHYA